MKGFHYFICWFLIGSFSFIFNNLLGIFVGIMAVLDAIIQFECHVCKRLDKANEVITKKINKEESK